MEIENGDNFDPLKKFFSKIRTLVREQNIGFDDEKEKNSDFVKKFKFSPIATLSEEDDKKSEINSPSDCFSTNIRGEKAISDEKSHFDILPFAPLCSYNYISSEAAYTIKIEDYWKAMIPRIKRRLKVRGDLIEHRDYEICDRGMLQFVVLLKEPTEAVKKMLYPDGMDEFIEYIKRIYDNCDSTRCFYVVPAATLENKDTKAVEDLSDESVSVEPVIVDISFLRSDWYNDKLTLDERKEFIVQFAVGLYNSLTLEHRIISLDYEITDMIMGKMSHDIVFDDYDEEESDFEEFKFEKNNESDEEDDEDNEDDEENSDD